jgi:hypothetical protein
MALTCREWRSKMLPILSPGLLLMFLPHWQALRKVQCLRRWPSSAFSVRRVFHTNQPGTQNPYTKHTVQYYFYY